MVKDVGSVSTNNQEFPTGRNILCFVPKPRLGVLIPESIPASRWRYIQEPAITLQTFKSTISLFTLVNATRCSNFWPMFMFRHSRHWYLNGQPWQNYHIFHCVHCFTHMLSKYCSAVHTQFFLCHYIQARCGTHTASCIMGKVTQPQVYVWGHFSQQWQVQGDRPTTGENLHVTHTGCSSKNNALE